LSTPAMKEHVRQLFGTDGIRGVAGEYPLDEATVYAIGRAMGTRLKRRDPNARVIFGQDTRESSAWISQVLARGLKDAGADFASAGVLTTPGVAYLTRTHGFAAGVVISASHNPWLDNGIKLFGPDGMKLADSIEHEIEEEIFAHIEEISTTGLSTPRVPLTDVLGGEKKLKSDYVQWLLASVDTSKLKRMRVIVDCANGAATSIVADVFGSVGMKPELINVQPDGKNINKNCGALHPEFVATKMAAAHGKYDVGITFDGDADRALFSDRHGNIVNGDGVLLIAARDMKARGRLKKNMVVATTMSNMGLEKALRDSQIDMVRAAVGDKYVLEEMLKSGASLGGEQSGHILFMDADSTTGDGILTALRVLEIIANSGQPLDRLVADLKVFPQIIKNVKVREKTPMQELPTVMEKIRAAEAELDGNGRVIVRYSGTEKLARVMIEAESEPLMTKHADAIANALQQAIGA
jgi:phosphoglucosamine mutase